WGCPPLLPKVSAIRKACCETQNLCTFSTTITRALWIGTSGGCIIFLLPTKLPSGHLPLNTFPWKEASETIKKPLTAWWVRNDSKKDPFSYPLFPHGGKQPSQNVSVPATF